VQPQLRLIHNAVEILQGGGVVVYPTDSAYALGCKIGEKDAIDRIRRLRKLDKNHNFTLMCRDLSELATYAVVDNSIYRLLRSHTPGPYTFLLKATQEVPRRLQHPKKKTIGLRIPDNVILQTLLAELHEPLMSVTLVLPDESLPVNDPEEVCDKLEKHVDLIIHGGASGFEETTIIDCVNGAPTIIRAGKGSVEGL
jgi:tRNA threonylcarbamoyl adenosine modification protein (Sua5/YciO/YrdC/YwlC family)